jgi:hypothetical protein
MQVGEGDREEHDHHRSRFINRVKMNESKQPIMASSWQSRGKGWGGRKYSVRRRNDAHAGVPVPIFRRHTIVPLKERRGDWTRAIR